MTKKHCMLIALVISLLLIISPISVKALDTYRVSSTSKETIMRLADESEEKETEEVPDRGGDTGEVADCRSGILTQDAIDLSHEILSYFRVLAPLFVIIYSAIDFTQAVLGKYDSREDAFATAKIKVGKRLLACLILIFIPTILKVLLNTFGDEIRINPDCVSIINNGEHI